MEIRIRLCLIDSAHSHLNRDFHIPKSPHSTNSGTFNIAAMPNTENRISAEPPAAGPVMTCELVPTGYSTQAFVLVDWG